MDFRCWILLFTIFSVDAFRVSQSADATIDKVIHKLEQINKDALKWQKKHRWIDVTGRNNVAVKASSNQLERAKQLRMVGADGLVAQLNKNYQHAKDQENNYRKWGGHRNSYAEWCCKVAKDQFYDAYLIIKGLAESVCEDCIDLDLSLVFSTTGGSSGFREVTRDVGVTTTTTISSELSTSIKASMEVPIKMFTVGLESTVSMKLAASMTTVSYQKHKDTLRIELHKPAYVYQMVASVENGLGSMFSIGGNMVISDKPIKRGGNGDDGGPHPGDGGGDGNGENCENYGLMTHQRGRYFVEGGNLATKNEEVGVRLTTNNHGWRQWIGWRSPNFAGRWFHATFKVKFLNKRQSVIGDGLKVFGKIHDNWLNDANSQVGTWVDADVSGFVPKSGDGNHVLLIFDRAPVDVMIKGFNISFCYMK